ncbi:hypothetical protein WJX72_007683 [[Myrmecia] bisecta]|uniref:WHEP-TRS domain-containing protein n=1 Tax=[Myrmecia] bisecta TaxID=41462 RepID=A0AAW1QAR4_9CHLO
MVVAGSMLSRGCCSARPAKQPLQVCAAKKKGGGGKKQAGSKMFPPKPPNPWQETSVIMHTLLLVESYRRQVGKPIMEDVEIADAAKTLFEAPFAVFSHNRGATEGPAKYTYANQAGLDLFETSWDEFVGTESSKTTANDVDLQADREGLIESIAAAGKARKWQGKRQSLKGRPVWIEDGLLWNIEGPSGKTLGQATIINAWEFEDGTRGGPASEPAPPAAAENGAAAEEQLAAAEAAVQEQADAVRDLKDNQGLTNADPEVKAAVTELLARKSKLESLQRWAESK